MTDFETKVLTYIREKGFQPFDQSLLLAVSGGIDSVAMLDFWNIRGREEFRCAISVAHVDHGIRPESGEDREFLEELCARLNVPIHVKLLDPASKPSEMSLEMWGRELRYNFFSELCRTGNYDRVLTAHNCDDQLETILLRIMRKCGLRGLQGIHFFRSPKIIRPFLNVSREDIQKYAQSNGLIWREDPSNQDTNIPRNDMRHNIIPFLKKDNPDILSSISRLTDDVQKLWPLFKKNLGSVIKTDKQNNPAILLKELTPLMDRYDESVFFLLMIMAEIKGVYFPESALLEFFRQWSVNPDSIRVSITSGMEILSKNGALKVMRKQLDKTDKNSKYDPIDVGPDRSGKPLHIRWGDRDAWFMIQRYLKPENFEIPRHKNLRAVFDGKELNKLLTIRNRRAGDRFSPLGTCSKTRKLKEYFNGIKYPVEQRDLQMLVCYQHEVIWIPGMEISDFYKVGSHTEEIIEMEIRWQD